MNNLEKVTASPETLGEFLSSLPVATGPWDESFHKEFCNSCERKDCDGEPCPHQDKRYNPMWWLMQEADAKEFREESDCVCVGYGAYLGGWNKSGENYLEGIEKVIFPKVSAYNPLLPERAELIMIFKSMEYADAVIKALDKMLMAMRAEPCAEAPADRLYDLEAAKCRGIHTWVSFEPVLDPEVVLYCINGRAYFIDKVKIGKLNYHPSGIIVNELNICVSRPLRGRETRKAIW